MNSLFSRPRAVGHAAAAFALTLAASLVAVPSARAEDGALGGVVSEFRFGAFDQDAELVPTEGGASIDTPEDGVAINAEILFVRPGIETDNRFLDFLVNPRPMIGGHYNTDGNTSFIYGGVAWDYQFDFGLYLEGSFGMGVHDGVLHTPRNADGFFYNDGRASLGSRYLFRESVDIGWTFGGHHRITGHLSHYSNAGWFDEANEGMDFIGIRYGYYFGD